MYIYMKRSSEAHTHRELIREWLREPRGSSLALYIYAYIYMYIYMKRSSEAHTHRELIREWLREPKGSSRALCIYGCIYVYIYEALV